MEANFNDKQSDILRETEEWLRHLSHSDAEITQVSLALLEEELGLFNKSILFQVAALKLAANDETLNDNRLRAAIALNCYVQHLLLCGWDSLIKGYYDVALHNVRTIEQAIITEIVVTLDPAYAQKFWNDKLRDGDALKAYEKALKKEDPSFGQNWGERRKTLRNMIHKYMHPSRIAVSHSIIIADDRKSASPSFGGYYVKEQCIRIGRLYADLSFDSAIKTSFAFREILPSDDKLKQQFDILAKQGTNLKAKWEKEMGFS